MARFEAVIFDLFGTLADNATPEEYRGALAAVATVLDVPPEEVTRAWNDTYEARNTGAFPTTRAAMEEICERLKIVAHEESIKAAIAARVSVMQRAMNLRPDAVETLRRLRQLGYRTGLISNCTPEVTALWQACPLRPLIDAPFFSCVCGLLKPDRRIYELALERLRAPAGRCLYVGDGESRELTGATEAGLHAVRIRAPGDEARDPYREPWPRVITGLGEVLGLLE